MSVLTQLCVHGVHKQEGIRLLKRAIIRAVDDGISRPQRSETVVFEKFVPQSSFVI